VIKRMAATAVIIVLVLTACTPAPEPYVSTYTPQPTPTLSIFPTPTPFPDGYTITVRYANGDVEVYTLGTNLTRRVEGGAMFYQWRDAMGSLRTVHSADATVTIFPR